jgi:hypothetical protein
MYIKNNIFSGFFSSFSFSDWQTCNLGRCEKVCIGKKQERKAIRTVFAAVTVDFLVHETSKSLFV